MPKIVLIVGYPAAGKTSLVKEFTDQGFVRINRDEQGGLVASLVPSVIEQVQAGRSVVLDNTFPTIESRKPFIDAAKKSKIPIECVWLATSMEDAQMNACLRMMERFRKVLSPEELAQKRGDPNSFAPAVIYKYRKDMEGETKGLKYPGKQYPTVKHGFTCVDKREFRRVWAPEYINEAILLDYDGTLRRSLGAKEWPTKPDEVEILPGRIDVLKQWKKKGFRLLGVSNQSAVAKGLDIEDCRACFERTNELLGFAIEYQFCPHKVPPITCYCRKPSSGMGAHFIHKYKLNPSKCIMVGDATSDKTFAERCGFQYQTPEQFFGV